MDFIASNQPQVPPAIIKLTSSDGAVFLVEVKVSPWSLHIKGTLDDLGVEGNAATPLSHNALDISGAHLCKIIEWAHHHKDDPVVAEDDETEVKPMEDLSSWDAEFLQVDQPTLFQMIRAANHLNFKGLLDVLCKKVANMIKGMVPEEIRQRFNIPNDLSPNQEEQVRRENSWCQKMKSEVIHGRSRTGNVIDMFSMGSVQDVDNEGGAVTQDCLNNSTVVWKILQQFSNTDLLELSFVNTLWNFVSRSLIKQRKNLMARLVCSDEQPCQQVIEAFGEDIRQMNVVSYSGVAIEINSTIHAGRTSTLESTYEAILAGLALKHLSIKLVGTWWDHKNCSAFLLTEKLFKNFSALLEHLTLDIEKKRVEFVRQVVQDFNFPHLKTLKLLEWMNTTDEAYVNYMKALVQRAPNLKELHIHGPANFMENPLDGTSALLVDNSIAYYPFREISFSLISVLRLVAMQLVNTGYGFDFEEFNVITPLLLRASCTATLRQLLVCEILAIPLMCYGIRFENVTKLTMSIRHYQLARVQPQILRIVKNFDFTQIFPKLHKVQIWYNSGDTEFLPDDKEMDAIVQQAIAVLRKPEPNRAANISELDILPGNLSSETASFYAVMFPDIRKLKITAEDEEIPYGSVWKHWSDLRELKIKQIGYQIENLDSVFCGIFPEEVAQLRQMDDEYLRRVNIVPVMPAITCLKNLKSFTFKHEKRQDDDEPYIGYDGTFMFSKVTGFIAFRRRPSLAVSLEFCSYGGPPATKHLEPFSSVAFYRKCLMVTELPSGQRFVMPELDNALWMDW